ncbi:LysM peptidoglycan-binding domain-containing protein [Dactylosporangium aurantiacum]|uniref:LysM peptidoglycan-binding domain-containing protein n=1 Tax=Dactylosporangium aurantiacum TaxID=35754 RepID=A0A9Q9IST1_9ACTN|nr:BTAD domain-containing putative transcriptional regulator [Dactylosporangium aurantiacum]MDG6107666.1 BTAD domain-containing putative transcriptional regulator [Dactylosporangium aurantiacum]UWZ58740.1 LysM peptidoglycan-binding domain-containing protein [Dactylosporangium aurantiacum]
MAATLDTTVAERRVLRFLVRAAETEVWMLPARTRSLPVRSRPSHGAVRLLLGGVTAVVGVACIAALPYPLWLIADACWHSIDWAETIDQPFNAPLLVLAAVAAAWAYWCWLLYATIADTVAVLRGTGQTRLRLPVPLHRTVTAAAGLLGTLLQPGIAAAGTTSSTTPALQAQDTTHLPTATMAATPTAAAVYAAPLVDTAAGEPAIYVVRRGDALFHIARTQLGDANRWPEIYTLNRGTRFANVGGTFTNPDVIYPGWRLKIPAPPALPTVPPADTTTTVQPPAPADTATTTAAAAPTQPATPTSTNAAPAPVASTTLRHQLTDLLPWLALLGIPALIALLRRRRRPHKVPAGRKPATTPAAPTDPTPTAARRSPRAATPPPAAAQTADARDAVRQLVAKAFRDDSPTDVIVPQATLRDLLPEQQTPVDHTALTVTDTIDEAIMTMEEQVLHRARLVAEHDADDYTDIRDLEALRPVTLITHANQHQRARITAALEQDYDVKAVILDEPTPTSETSGSAAPVRTEPTTAATAVTTSVVAALVPANDTAPQKVQVRVIGDVAVLDRHGRPVPGMRGRAKEMLTYLAVHRDGAELPDIMEALWPDATVPRATERLSTEVGNLRRTVRRAAGDGSIQAVHNPGGRYILNTDVLDIDAWQLADALTTTPDSPGREALLRAAVAVHTDELAGDAPYAWIEAARERCRRQGITARQQLADLVAATNPAEAAALLDAAADIDPYSDTLAQAAITASATLGATDAATRRYQQLRAALADIGEQPDPATTTLAETVLGPDAVTADHDEVAA